MVYAVVASPAFAAGPYLYSGTILPSFGQNEFSFQCPKQCYSTVLFFKVPNEFTHLYDMIEIFVRVSSGLPMLLLGGVFGLSSIVHLPGLDDRRRRRRVQLFGMPGRQYDPLSLVIITNALQSERYYCISTQCIVELNTICNWVYVGM